MAFMSSFRRVLGGSASALPSQFAAIRHNTTLTSPKLFISGCSESYMHHCHRLSNETKHISITKQALLYKQDDAVAYINDALKQGTEISSFRKDKIGGDEKRTSYWYDGNTIIGHRLYKEVTVIESKTKVRGKGCLNLPNISFQWETLATNLEEFQKVMDELSSSKVAGERDAAKTIETDAIPALEKLQKLQDGWQWILC